LKEPESKGTLEIEKIKELEKVSRHKELEIMTGHNEVEKLIDNKLTQPEQIKLKREKIKEPENENGKKRKPSEPRESFFPGYIKWVVVGAAVGVAFYFWWKRSQ